MDAPPVAKSTLLTHLDYTLWASSKLLDAASRLSESQLVQDLQVSHGSILGTLQHIYYADRTWLARLQKVERPFADPGAGPSLDELKEQWPRQLAALRTWVEAFPEHQLGEDLNSRRLNGAAFTCAYWKVLLHVVNHATLHRGQVVAMLRQLGHTPPSTDLFYYYLQHS